MVPEEKGNDCEAKKVGTNYTTNNLKVEEVENVKRWIQRRSRRGNLVLQ